MGRDPVPSILNSYTSAPHVPPSPLLSPINILIPVGESDDQHACTTSPTPPKK
jgi:hypothetical protein